MEDEEVPAHTAEQIEEAFALLEGLTDHLIRHAGALLQPVGKGECAVSVCSLELRKQLTGVTLILGRGKCHVNEEKRPVFTNLNEAQLYNIVATMASERMESELFNPRELRQHWVIVEPAVIATKQ